MELEILYICENLQKNITKELIQSKAHTHDHPELSIILSGTAQYEIDHKPYTISDGEMILFDPNTVHSVTIPSQSCYSDLHIGINHFVGCLSEHAQTFSNGFAIIKLGKYQKDIYELCKKLNLESTQRDQDCKLMLQGLVLQLFVLISRELSNHQITNIEPTTMLGYPDKHKVVAFMEHYILENYMNEISLEMFAKNMYLSQVYISKIFKEETGHSPIHFLIQTRLSKAKELLETENLPIKSISSQVGYEDAYHFSKLFKKYYGYPPSLVKAKK